MARESQPFDLSTLGGGWATDTDSNGQPFAVLEREIEVSPNDDRKYRFLTLRNGLRALLISDPKTDKAAAALGVQVGHLSDPDDLAGLAHFCEHMLFLGTERFPDEAEYKTYLSRHSGSSNAYTSLAETVYHFDCTPEGLPGALSRHAQFFTAPLFDASCTERELNAVDSEFRRNLQLDARRLFQLGKETSSRASRYWKFGTGSKETLWRDDTRDRLLAWYEREYSANLMNLVLLSNHSLDDLASLVIAEYSDIPNANLAATKFPEPPITAKEASSEISYRTIKDSPQLRIEFGLPDLRKYWATKPGHFISHYVGHEGPGSILAELKARSWATSLSSSSDNGAAGFDFFRVNIKLTASGLEHYEDVISIVFAYIDLLRRTSPQQWAFDEVQRLGQIGWRWKEKGQPQSATRNLASQLGETLYPPEKQLVGPWFATHWDEHLIRQMLDHLRLDNCRIFLGSQQPIVGRDFWQSKEQHYGTEFDIRPLDTPVNPPADLRLPDRNIFVPEQLELLNTKPADEPVMRPTLVRETPKGRLFVKRDDQWCIPRGSAFFLLRSPVADSSPLQAMLTQLVTSLVEEALAKYSYDATLAGLDYSLGTEQGGILLAVSGYTDKLPLLVSVVLDKLASFKVDAGEYAIVHDRLSRAYRNAKLQNPSSLADAELRRLTRQTYWTGDQRLEALQKASPQAVEQHTASLLKQLSIDSLVHGNFRNETAVDMLDKVEDKLQASAAAAEAIDYHRALKLPPGTTNVFRSPVPSEENVNSAVSVYYEIGPATDYELLARLSLFAQIAKVPVFSTLRTKEQLGYIVSSAPWVINAYAGFRVIVQSERTAEYLDERIEALWAGFGDHLAQLSEDEFAKERESVALKKLEKPKSLGQETSRYWQEIQTGELDFDFRQRQAALVRRLSKEDLIAFFARYISPSSPERTKLAVLLRSQRFQSAALGPLLDAVRQVAPEKADEAERLVAAKPTIEQVEAFVDATGAHPALKNELAKLELLPALPSGVRELEEKDVESFRKTLERAEGYKPVTDAFEGHARL
ncbi:uncharacterized protein JCM10292_001210 [Rhodotorula paludigena]|uniref:uncharacterized protein n=1 Tax=Rhodotorula paludigena TaxID=86838 RepID=UPI00317EF4ED